MKIIKINITCLVALLSVLFIGCEVDYKDIDTLGKADSGASEVSINLDLFVAGSWTPDQVATSAGELKVEKYDLFIFKVSSDGNYLEYKEMNITRMLLKWYRIIRVLRLGIEILFCLQVGRNG